MFNTNHRHMYTTDKQSDKYREQLGKWMRNYSIENFGEDWDYCIGLSYRYPVVSKRKSYSNMKNFYSKLKKMDKNIQGFVVTEVDKSMVSLHHHLIVKSKLDFDIFKRNISNIWDKKGISWTEPYDGKRKYVEYMCKHVDKMEENSFDFLTNLE